MATKRAYRGNEGAFAGDEGFIQPPPTPAKKRPAKKSKYSQPFVDARGWNIEPPSLIWKSFGDAVGSSKIAAFNLESTLINRKSAAPFPKDGSDWRWWNAATPAKLVELLSQGYKLAAFTNQSGIQGAFEGAGKEKVEVMLDAIYDDLARKAGSGVAVALQVFIAPSREADSCRKPARGMWDFMLQNCNDGIAPDLASSFYVMDGSAQTAEHSDRQFGAAIGLPLKMPADVFGPVDGKMVIGRETVRQAKEGVASGENPNADLVRQLKEMGQMMLEAHKARIGGDAMVWKARAMSKAANSLATFPEQVTDANLKAVSALQGVGKQTMKRVKQYLATGSVKLDDEEEEVLLAGC